MSACKFRERVVVCQKQRKLGPFTIGSLLPQFTFMFQNDMIDTVLFYIAWHRVFATHVEPLVLVVQTCGTLHINCTPPYPSILCVAALVPTTTQPSSALPLLCTQFCVFIFWYRVLFGPRNSTLGQDRRFEPRLSRTKERRLSVCCWCVNKT